MIRVQQEDFDPQAEAAALTAGRTDIGGIVTFTGLVRELIDNEGRPAAISAMTLEHYPGMTEKMLAEIEAEANARWPLAASLIVHRYGRSRAIASSSSPPPRRTATPPSRPTCS